MVPRLRSLLFSTSPVSSCPGKSSGAQLSVLGHLLIFLALLIVAWVQFKVSHSTIRRLTADYKVCGEWEPSSDPRTGEIPLQKQLPKHALQRPYRQTQQMISGLSAASPGQQLRLSQQLESILNGMDSSCRITRFALAEAWALQSVGTAAAILCVICLLIAAPRGISGSSRTLITVFMTSSFVLGISYTYSSMVDLQRMHTDGFLVYRQLGVIFNELSSSVANNLLSAKLVSSGSAVPLDSSRDVANLIVSIDEALAEVTLPLWKVEARFEKSIFDRTLLKKD